eukprot:TRINITY_DN4911_c0_g2_i1.p1 TRINITY_DN4911_c0_g2~~TRINITY_DN4911_c0_g2_i1.p1  ORF type:complete len:286 (-),score=53.43 TRINITY_DN4911_c0_g2_i1:19-798(-)
MDSSGDRIINGKVLLIGLDGVRSDLQLLANTPSMDSIGYRVDSLGCVPLYTCESRCGWTAMFTGTWMWQTSYDLASIWNPSYFEQHPTFFTRLKTVNPNITTAAMSSWEDMEPIMFSKDVDLFIPTYKNPLSTTYVATNIVSDYGFDADVVFIYIEDVDYEGHHTGFMPTKRYMTRIEDVDDMVGKILDSLQSREKYEEENWLIILSTDHGGFGENHFQPEAECSHTFIYSNKVVFTNPAKAIDIERVVLKHVLGDQDK